MTGVQLSLDELFDSNSDTNVQTVYENLINSITYYDRFNLPETYIIANRLITNNLEKHLTTAMTRSDFNRLARICKMLLNKVDPQTKKKLILLVSRLAEMRENL